MRLSPSRLLAWARVVPPVAAVRWRRLYAGGGVSGSVQLGLVLALLTAFGSVAGFLYKFRGAREAPGVELRRPWHSTVELFRSPLYTLGIAIALGSWGLHVGALTLAPISLVQSVIAGGLVLLTVVADRMFGIAVTRREWICVGLTAAGLAFLAATLDGDAGSAHSNYRPSTLAIYLVVLAVAATALVVVPSLADSQRHTSESARSRPALLAVSAGLLWAASDTSIKALSSHLSQLGFGVLLQPLAFVILVASLVGLLVSARSLQLGDAVPMIALTSAAANLTTIAAGPIVFAEPLPSSNLGLAIRILAFAFVIVAAALIPPPAAERGRSSEPAPGSEPAASPEPAASS